MQDLNQLIAMLSGGGPEMTGGLANTLRRRHQLGQLGALSGDKVLGPFGAGLADETTKHTEQLAQNQDRNQDRRVLENYYKAIQENNAGNLGMRGKELEEEARNNDLDFLAAMGANDARLAAAQKGRPVPNALRAEFMELGEVGRGLHDLTEVTPYKQEWESKIPGMRPLKNTIARVAPAFASEEDIASQEWQGKFKRMYDLATRHNLFGATLTPGERTEYAKASINENFTKAQIDRFMKDVKANLSAKGQSLVDGYSDVYGGDTVISLLGLPEEYLGGTSSGQEGQPDPASDDPYSRAFSSVEILE